MLSATKLATKNKNPITAGFNDLSQWALNHLEELFNRQMVVQDLQFLADEWDAVAGDEMDNQIILQKLGYLYDDLYVAAQFILSYIHNYCENKKIFAPDIQLIDTAYKKIKIKAECVPIPILPDHFMIFFNYTDENFYQQILVRRYVNLNVLAKQTVIALKSGIEEPKDSEDIVEIELGQATEIALLYFKNIAAKIIKNMKFFDEQRRRYKGLSKNIVFYEVQADNVITAMDRENCIDKLPFFREFLRAEKLDAFSFIKLDLLEAKINAFDEEPDTKDIVTTQTLTEISNAVDHCFDILAEVIDDEYDFRKIIDDLAPKPIVTLADGRTIPPSEVVVAQVIKNGQEPTTVSKLKKLGVSIIDGEYKIELKEPLIYFDTMSLERELNKICKIEDEKLRKVKLYGLDEKFNLGLNCIRWLQTVKQAEVGVNFDLKAEMEEQEEKEKPEVCPPATISSQTSSKVNQRKRKQKKKKTKPTPQYSSKDKSLTTEQTESLSDEKKSSSESVSSSPATTPTQVSPNNLPDITPCRLSEIAERRNSFKAQRRTSENENPLDVACKHLLYLRKIMANNELEQEIKHYALLYNVVCCFSALQKYKQNEEKDSRQELILLIDKSVRGILSAEVIQELVNNISMKACNEKGLYQWFPELKINAAGDIGKTKIYVILAEFFNKLKIKNEDSVMENVVFTYTGLMQIILTKHIDSTKLQDTQRFSDEDLFDFHALRMVAVMVGEYVGKNDNQFLQFCYAEGAKGISYENRGSNLHSAVVWFTQELKQRLPALKRLSIDFSARSASSMAITSPTGSPRLFANTSPKAIDKKQLDKNKKKSGFNLR